MKKKIFVSLGVSFCLLGNIFMFPHETEAAGINIAKLARLIGEANAMQMNNPANLRAITSRLKNDFKIDTKTFAQQLSGYAVGELKSALKDVDGGTGYGGSFIEGFASGYNSEVSSVKTTEEIFDDLGEVVGIDLSELNINKIANEKVRDLLKSEKDDYDLIKSEQAKNNGMGLADLANREELDTRFENQERDVALKSQAIINQLEQDRKDYLKRRKEILSMNTLDSNGNASPTLLMQQQMALQANEAFYNNAVKFAETKQKELDNIKTMNQSKRSDLNKAVAASEKKRAEAIEKAQDEFYKNKARTYKNLDYIFSTDPNDTKEALSQIEGEMKDAAAIGN